MNSIGQRPGPRYRPYLEASHVARGGIALFCFPYAGGDTWIFREWARHLAPRVGACAMKLPGRGDRLRDKPATNLRALAQTMANAVTDELHVPYAVFGHSMGALLAFEFALALAASNIGPPSRLIVSAARAPSRLSVDVPLHILPDDEFLEAVQRRYAHPSLTSIDAELLQIFLPALRADMEMYETYRCHPGAVLSCPISVFTGSAQTVPASAFAAWSDHTSLPIQHETFPGGHFFIHDSEMAVIETVRRLLNVHSESE